VVRKKLVLQNSFKFFGPENRLSMSLVETPGNYQKLHKSVDDIL